MKKYTATIVFVFLTITLFAQVDTIQPPYKKFPTYPPVKLLMPDSISYFTKDKLPKKEAIMLVLFNPQCDHCQHETEEIVKNIERFKSVQIVMATSASLASMKEFMEKYKLTAHKNITIGQDTHYFLPSYYMIRNLPFLAFYNKKKELISVFEGSMPIEKALEELKK